MRLLLNASQTSALLKALASNQPEKMSCEHCVAGEYLPGEPKGTLLPDNSAYYAEGADKTRAIIFLTDIFGLPLVNCKIMADRFAEEVGCDVWVPDLFEGSPPLGLNDLSGLMPEVPGQKLSWTAIFSLVWLFARRAGRMISHSPAKGAGRAEIFIKRIKEEKKYAKVGAVGYCFGGSVACRLAPKGLFDSVAIAHPGGITDPQVEAINIPSIWLCAEEDRGFPAASRQKAEATLAARKGKENFVEYEFHDFKGTCHGFAARPNLSIPSVKEGYEGAFEASVKWFKKMLW